MPRRATEDLIELVELVDALVGDVDGPDASDGFESWLRCFCASLSALLELDRRGSARVAAVAHDTGACEASHTTQLRRGALRPRSRSSA